MACFVSVVDVRLLFGMVVAGQGSQNIQEIVRQDEAEAAFQKRHRRRREEDVFAARQLEQIDRTGHFLCVGCASLAEYGEANGLSGREARTLAAAGRALELRPALEEGILSRKLSVEAVAALGRVFENPLPIP